MKKICVVTGTRAEYGLLKNLLKKLNNHPDFELQLIVTGSHLSTELGMTYREIESDGIPITEKIEILLSSDSEQATIKAMSLAMIDFSFIYKKNKPDLLIILGDRFEILAAAQTALIFQIPIAHIHGGENTFGAYDDAIRHSITKMSHWHFVSSADHRKRVIQLGEHPSRVFNVGAVGIEYIFNLKLMSKEKIYDFFGFAEEDSYMLITMHSETASKDATNTIDILLNILSKYNMKLVFTKANADHGGREINKKIIRFVEENKNARIYDSLGQLKYLSAVKYAKAVIGNSSSGLIEAPYLQTPTVNIGNRQKGRSCPNSVFTTKNTEKSIKNGINEALSFSNEFEKIFGDGHATDKIMNILERISQFKVQKEFYDL